jgi:ATP-dependent Clp protease ATP-binding subunit ClpB
MIAPAAKEVFQKAKSIAKSFRNNKVEGAHIILSLLNNDFSIVALLAQYDKDYGFIREWAEAKIEDLNKIASIEEVVLGSAVDNLLHIADLIRIQGGKDFIDPECLFVASIKPGILFSADELRLLPINYKEAVAIFLDDDTGVKDSHGIKNENAAKNTFQQQQGFSESASANESVLEKYSIDKTQQAIDQKLDPIYGREKEIKMIVEVLSRRNKPNVIITGEPGVGKSALLDGLALSIVNEEVPDYLHGAKIFELDTGALVAGASYKGEVEDRLKKIIAELKNHDKAILFIDEIHILLDPKSSVGSGVANLLKPELARGELTLIGATTNEEYRKYIETDEAFARRFELVKVEEPDPALTNRMIKHVIHLYEKHHDIKVTDAAIGQAVTMAKRYAKERSLPDSAFDIIDRTMSAAKILSKNGANEVEKILKELDLYLETEETVLHQAEDVLWLIKNVPKRINPILLKSYDIPADSPDLDQLYQRLQIIRHKLAEIRELAATAPKLIDDHDVAALVSYKTGIPMGKIQADEKDKLQKMKEILQQRVVGQDHAIDKLVDTIMESRSGLIKGGQPIGSFFFLGPTGTGKTELAKALADFLFNDESYLLRFDMSEFKEEHSAALLYGAPPGYVGYEEGGVLVNKIREKPYSVVLFDEIEKAHPSVFDLFLQILDEGKLHDRLGKEGDFSNAVVLFTSNIGSDYIAGKFSEGIIPESQELMEIMARYFRPEFLARVTEIVPFAPISEDTVELIFDIHLNAFKKILKTQGIELELGEEKKKELVLKGFNPKYGARPLKGVIRSDLRRPISRKIVSGELKQGDKFIL